jgi:hypothetical protein
MTDDDLRKWMMDTQEQQSQRSLPPQLEAPGASDSEASGPNTDPTKTMDPATLAQNAQQASLKDQYGTGFINFGQYGAGSPVTKQYQPIPDSSGSLYDPLAAAGTPTAAKTPALPAQPPPTDYSTEPQPGEGPVMKPPFQRTRNMLGYRGGDY